MPSSPLSLASPQSSSSHFHFQLKLIECRRMACQRGSLHLLFLVLLLAPAAFSDLCSRQLSREAQEIISMVRSPLCGPPISTVHLTVLCCTFSSCPVRASQELSVLLLELHLNVSNHCVFDPSADMYKDQVNLLCPCLSLLHFIFLRASVLFTYLIVCISVCVSPHIPLFLCFNVGLCVVLTVFV